MYILTIRTDKPEAEIGLYQASQQQAYETWQAHRQLAETIHSKLQQLLDTEQLSFAQLKGIVVFQGPGSFTGLRIGITVANALAYALKIPIVATQGDDWQNIGISRLQAGDNETIALPEYGAPVHITQPRS